MTMLAPDLAQESLSAIERACREQNDLYRRQGASDGSFCLELFRRALSVVRTGADNAPIYANEEARTRLVALYSEYIRAQINRRALRSLSMDDLVQVAWLRFWQAAQRGLVFASLDQALHYLKLVARSAVIVARREEREQWRKESLSSLLREDEDRPIPDTHADVWPQHLRRRFDTRCRELITDALDRRIFWMRFSMGYAPREIAVILSSEGVLLTGKPPTARRVSDCIERIFDQLELDQEIRDLLQSD